VQLAQFGHKVEVQESLLAEGCFAEAGQNEGVEGMTTAAPKTSMIIDADATS
jgi:hypothetical protein